MEDNSPPPERLDPQVMTSSDDLDLSALSPKEVVDLHDLAFGYRTVERQTPSDLYRRFQNTVDNLPYVDLERAKTVLTALAESSWSEDRINAAGYLLLGVIRLDHDAGVPVFDRLVRDQEPSVRNGAMTWLEDCLIECQDKAWLVTFYRRGLHLLDTVDAAAFQGYTGLTRQDAYDLMRSHAYAENGQDVFDLGWEALRKIPNFRDTYRETD